MACPGITTAVRRYGSHRTGFVNTYGAENTYSNIELGTLGYEALIDENLASGRSGANHMSIGITHTTGALCIIYSVEPVLEVSSNVFTGWEAFVDRSCAERVSVRVTHTAGSLLRIDKMRPEVSLRSRRQPGV